MMLLVQIILGLAAAVALGGLVCRLVQMNWRTHQAAVVGMHGGLALGCVWALHDLVAGIITPGTAGAVAAACCWLWASLPTWPNGPPRHTEMRRVPLGQDMAAAAVDRSGQGRAP